VPDVLRITSGGNVFSAKAYKDGMFYAQVFPALCRAMCLSPKKTIRFWICGRAGRQTFGAAILSAGPTVTACDINTAKLDLLRRKRRSARPSKHQGGSSATPRSRRPGFYRRV
jgi:16S rRNA C967 or C1407 C5-methylase (RsmB/RsmF family)